ncbi:MAG: 50S ribosomal protein L19 [Planctomycetota bacterium]
MNILRQIECENMKSQIPEFGVGDTVSVHYLIREGDKERVQMFIGTVIAISGSGVRRTATVRRIVAGEGVERVFPLHSPKIQAIEVRSRGRVRRARLYYLRDRIGKATRLDANLKKHKGPRSVKRRKKTAGGSAGAAE